jgi:molybdopterin adenylyltransferase
MITVGILTISDSSYRGEREDLSGPLIREMVVEHLGAKVELEAVVPDEFDIIKGTLVVWADEVGPSTSSGRGLDLILTTGGTGFGPRDVTPEATSAVIEREAPGLAEAMRAKGFEITPHAILSRAVAGIRSHTLIVNLPGSPKAVREDLEVILPALPHGIELLQGGRGGHEYRGTEVPGTC